MKNSLYTIGNEFSKSKFSFFIDRTAQKITVIFSINKKRVDKQPFGNNLISKINDQKKFLSEEWLPFLWHANNVNRAKYALPKQA